MHRIALHSVMGTTMRSTGPAVVSEPPETAGGPAISAVPEVSPSQHADGLEQPKSVVVGRFGRKAAAVAAAYAVFATLWISVSDHALTLLVDDAEAYALLSLTKGLAFVMVTAVLLLGLMWRAFASTERALEALQHSELRLMANRSELEAVVNSALDGIVTLDAMGRVADFNAAAERLFGWRSNEVIGRPLSAFLEGGIRIDSRELQILAAVHGNGTHIPVEAAVTPIVGDTGARHIAILRDISRRVRSEAALQELNETLEQKVEQRTADLAAAKRQAESADRLKSAFLATMSHELRTPLNSIIGFTGILLQKLSGPLVPEQERQLGMVRDSARHLLELINDILDLSKIEAGQLPIKRERFNLRELLALAESAIRPLAASKHLALELDLPALLPDMCSDRRRVAQILLNLLNNAVKFTERGTVTLRVRVLVEDPAGSRASTVLFEVEDTGIGIRPEDLDRLFVPFLQIDSGLSRQHEGTGLGLAICEKLSDLLGGRIEVQSRWGAGSCFRVRLPLDPSEAPEGAIATKVRP